MFAARDQALELRDYLLVLRRRKWTIGLTAALVIAIAVGASLAQTKVYQGVASVLLQPKSTESLFDPSNGQRNDPIRAVQTEIQVLRSRPVRDLVTKRLGSVPNATASPVGQTDVIEVKAEHTDPRRAADVANAYARAYIEFRRTQAVDDLLAAADEIQSKISDLQKRADSLVSPPVASGRNGATTSPESMSQRDSLLQQQALFRQKLDQLQVDAALKSGGAQLVTPAVPPVTPIRPTPKRNGAIALVLGLVLGIAAAILREYLDDSLKTKEDVDRAATGLPVLGLIPALPGWKDKKSALVVSLSDPKSPAAEAYRALRTSVQFLGIEKKLRAIQVTSPSAAEGKSTTIANLAVALAGAGQRVVAVDADMRRPRVDRFFGLDEKLGLTSILLGDASLEDALQSSLAVEGLSILASGPIPPNPSELLAGDQFRQLLRRLEDRFDVVLIDCPPVLPVTDATVLAASVDGTLLVATAGQTQRRELHRAAEMLQQVQAPVLGVVFNGVTDDGSYGYSYGYRYAYTSEPKKKSADDGPDQKGRSAKRGRRSKVSARSGHEPRPSPPSPVRREFDRPEDRTDSLSVAFEERQRAAHRARSTPDEVMPDEVGAATDTRTAPDPAHLPSELAPSVGADLPMPVSGSLRLALGKVGAAPEEPPRGRNEEATPTPDDPHAAGQGLTEAAKQLLKKYGMPSEPPPPHPASDASARLTQRPTATSEASEIERPESFEMPTVPSSESRGGPTDDDLVKWWEQPAGDRTAPQPAASAETRGDDIVAALERAVWADDPRWTSP
jgi:succinoglycan biosynthesis transport protein ExoP